MTEAMTKQQLCEAMRAAGVKHVTIEYSGSGDEGFMGDVSYQGDGGTELPDTEPLLAEWSALHDRALEAAGLDGYWNNDGGCGHISLNVETGELTISHGWYETVYNEDGPKEVDVE